MFVGLDEVDGELPQRRGARLPEVVRDTSLHGLDVGGRAAGARYRHRHARRQLLLGHQPPVQRHVSLSPRAAATDITAPPGHCKINSTQYYITYEIYYKS